MAKKKKYQHKDPKIFNEKPENLDGLKRLKGGELVFYRNLYLIDKCKVESVDKKSGVATLSNGVKVSSGILPNNNLLRLGTTTENTVIKLWDDSCDSEFDYVQSKYFIRGFIERLSSFKENCKDKDTICKLSEKLRKLSEKFDIK